MRRLLKYDPHKAQFFEMSPACARRTQQIILGRRWLPQHSKWMPRIIGFKLRCVKLDKEQTAANIASAYALWLRPRQAAPDVYRLKSDRCCKQGWLCCGETAGVVRSALSRLSSSRIGSCCCRWNSVVRMPLIAPLRQASCRPAHVSSCCITKYVRSVSRMRTK